ncbi:MAG TPA: polysaccharide deacetylase family protein [Xanthobacteraceae bacterium]
MLQNLLTGISRKAARHHCSKRFVMRNRTPLVSFTFDDVPDSAYRNGAAILDERGVRGTFYVAAGTCGSPDTYWRVIEPAQVRALNERGHEIGCHTFSHVGVDRLDAGAMEEECRQNAAALQALCGDIAITNFCYPFGRTSLARKLQLQQRFDTCRGIYEGINAGTADLALLKVIELYDRTLTADKLQRVLRETRARNGWLIFYTHDVADPPSWIGCSPALLRATVAAVAAEGFACLPIRDALEAIGYAAALSPRRRPLRAPAGP